MDDDLGLGKLKADELFALATFVADFNIHFFHDWAQRMRPFDEGAFDVLNELAADAAQYYEALHSTAVRLFGERLPHPDPELCQQYMRRVELPGNRYFITFATEANIVLSAALALQKEAIGLFMQIDEVFEDAWAWDGLGRSGLPAGVRYSPTSKPSNKHN